MQDECYGYGYDKHCKKVPVEKCEQVPIQVPKQIPRQKCHQVPKEHCHQVPKQIPRERCHQVPRYDQNSWLPDVYNEIFRLYGFEGLWLRYATLQI